MMSRRRSFCPATPREDFLSSIAEIVARGAKSVSEAPLPTRALHRDGRRFSTELFLYPRRIRYIDAGMDDYVSKPVTLDSVAEALSRYTVS